MSITKSGQVQIQFSVALDTEAASTPTGVPGISAAPLVGRPEPGAPWGSPGMPGQPNAPSTWNTAPLM
jgi:hypothetical protein